MAVDPCFAAMLADPRNEARPPPPHVSMEKARRSANSAMLGAAGPSLHGVADIVIPIAGRNLGARLYRPSASPALPILLYLHGGGWVWGSLDTHDAVCRTLAQRAGCAVLSLDYRLAPETPFPGPTDDAFAALQWLAASAAALGLDPQRLAIGGDSAGGTLAVVAALRARSEGPGLRRLVLMYPALDPACDSASQEEFAEGHILTRNVMRWFWSCHLGGNEAKPLFRADLSGLPGTSVATAECDILRDEGEAFAGALAAAGVQTKLRRYDGMIHGFVSFPQLTPQASACLADIAQDLKSTFAALETLSTP